MSCTEFLAQVAAIIWGISWINVALIVGVLLGGLLIYKAQVKKDNTFDIIDLLVDDETRKASFSKISIIVFAALSVWVIVKLVQGNHATEVVTLLPIVLGIFVGARVLNNIFGKLPQDQTSTVATVMTSTTSVNSTPDVANKTKDAK